MTMIQAVGVLIIRFWAAHLFVRSILSLKSSYIDLLGKSGPTAYHSFVSVLYPLSHVATLLLGIFAFILARPVIRLLMPDGSGRSRAPEAETDRLVFGGTALIGLYYLVQYLPLLLGAAAAQWQLERRGEVAGSSPGIFTASIIVVAALALMIRLRHLLYLRRKANAFLLKAFSPESKGDQAADN